MTYSILKKLTKTKRHKAISKKVIYRKIIERFSSSRKLTRELILRIPTMYLVKEALERMQEPIIS